uniref:Late embryogenesis abundant protein LEA-2 subgroup domain-containing protein n=1 Tax=Picea sitchensis TaxID=3332 RepID=B8LQB9_PICSI|nr:unknown [Picea sitchensis]
MADEAGAAKEAVPLPSPGRPTRRLFGRVPAAGFASLLSGFLITLVIILGAVTLVLWLVYRPHKPRFYVEGAAVYQLNVTDGSVSSSMQFSVIVANPNRRLTVHYDRLVAFVRYRGEVITLVTPMANLYEGHRSFAVLSPMVGGNFVPLFPDAAGGLLADQAYGLVDLRLEIRGRIRWTTGFWKSSHYHLAAKCDLLLSVKQVATGGEVPLLGGQDCHVDV